MSTRTILVVDDDPVVRQATKRMLERAGFEVATAPSGRKAEAYLIEPERPVVGLVLCDEDMGGMPGHELHQRTAPVLWQHRVGFIIMSGGTIDPEAVAYRAKAGIGAVSKPFSPKDLIRLVKAYLGLEETEKNKA